jgi:hypothetical protein
MEPDNIIKTPSDDFVLIAADGDIHSSSRRFNHHGQKLLAKRGRAERTKLIW